MLVNCRCNALFFFISDTVYTNNQAEIRQKKQVNTTTVEKNMSIIHSKNKKNHTIVGVLFGGRSAEHEISLRSAIYVLKNLPARYSIVPIGISREGEFHSLEGHFNAKDFNEVSIKDLEAIVSGRSPKSMPHVKNLKSTFYPFPQAAHRRLGYKQTGFRNLNASISCIFPVLHGPNGEDGRLQSLFELADIPYVGCDRVGSVVGMDKDIQKRLVRDAGINVAKYLAIEREEFDENQAGVCDRVEKSIGYPNFVKPNALGSAVGAGKAHDKKELIIKLKAAFEYDNKVLVEELMHGTEIECAFLGTSYKPRITTPGEIATEDFYSYDEKYSASSKAQLFVPARLDEAQTQHVKSLAKDVARVLGLRSFARIDFWSTQNSRKIVFNEVNTIPGLTSISMFPKLWEYEGVTASMWLEELVENSRFKN